MDISERDLIIKVSETIYKLDNNGREKFLLLCDAFALGVETGRKCQIPEAVPEMLPQEVDYDR